MPPKPSAPEEDDLSAKMRLYLAKIYRLADFGSETAEYVSTSALADSLFVTAPAVNRMVTRLKEGGLLEHEPYKGIRLTATGRTEALKHLRVHRIIEAFLVTVMGLDWSEVHEEATRLSETTSDAILERMNQMAGNPRFCPHGEPIPNADGQVEPIHDVLLSQVNANQTVRVTRMRTRETDRLKYLEALHITPNTTLEVLHIAPFNGPLQLKLGQEYRIIGHNLAELVRVVKV